VRLGGYASPDVSTLDGNEADFPTQIVDIQEGDEAGVKSVTILVTGEFAYGYLQTERGVHRLVRNLHSMQKTPPYLVC